MDVDAENSHFKSSIFMCEECGRTFATMSGLLSHKMWKHEKPATNVTCSTCQKTFSRKDHLMKHTKVCRGPQDDTVIFKTRCSLCDVCDTSRPVIHNHYQKHHKIDLTEQQVMFDSIEDFNIWKAQFELDTKSNFVKNSGTKMGKNNTQIDKYLCHRDGNSQAKGGNIRNIKVRESIKIGSYCPARIYVYISNDNVTVKYIGTHLGHENEIGRLHIPNSEKERLAQKIAQQIPFNEILDEVRNSIPDKPNRVHLLDRQDLRNISKKYNLNYKDAESGDGNFLIDSTTDLKIEEANDILPALSKINSEKADSHYSLFEKKEKMKTFLANIVDNITSDAEFKAFTKLVDSIVPTLAAVQTNAHIEIKENSALVLTPAQCSQVPPNKKIMPQKKLFSTQQSRKTKSNRFRKSTSELREKVVMSLMATNQLGNIQIE